MLTKFADNIWICEAPLKLYGVDLGTRMTIIDLDGQGSLFVHSPIKLSEQLKNEIDALGKIKYVVAPNKWHHLSIGEFKAVYPSAKFYCAQGLEKKRSDFCFEAVIGHDQNYPWNEALGHKLVEGVPIFNEIVFFHHQTKTLIVTDLATHICESSSFFTRTILKLLGSYGQFGWAKLEKLYYVRNRKAFKASVENILRWDIERILLTHGAPITFGGKELLKKAFP
jgi:hypothetical protein